MTRPRRRPAAALAALALAAAPGLAVELTLSPDEPADLSGTTFLAPQTVLDRDGAHSLRFDGPAAGLPESVSIAGLVQLEDGAFLFTVDAPFDDGGTTYLPRDVIRRSGGTYSLELDGADLGLSAAARIDALALLSDGRLAVSFDAPETVGGTTWQPADAAVVDGGALSPLFDAAGAGLGPADNVVALDRDDSGAFYLAFDAPADAGGQTFQPDQVARWDGSSWSLWYTGGLPPGSGLSALSLPGSPGDVTGLRVAKGAPDQLDLSWDPSCSTEVADYAIYEGALGGDFASHAPATCSTGGATADSLVPAAGSRYFLTVALNGTFEGSHGRASSGAERAQGMGPCRTEQRVRACP